MKKFEKIGRDFVKLVCDCNNAPNYQEESVDNNRFQSVYSPFAQDGDENKCCVNDNKLLNQTIETVKAKTIFASTMPTQSDVNQVMIVLIPENENSMRLLNGIIVPLSQPSPYVDKNCSEMKLHNMDNKGDDQRRVKDTKRKPSVDIVRKVVNSEWYNSLDYNGKIKAMAMLAVWMQEKKCISKTKKGVNISIFNKFLEDSCSINDFKTRELNRIIKDYRTDLGNDVFRNIRKAYAQIFAEFDCLESLLTVVYQ